jgi:hypothetical protein
MNNLNPRNRESDSFDLPIIIDDQKNFDDFNMTRCSYYTIECEDPVGNWEMKLRERNIPCHLLGISGVIFKPIGEKRYFESPEDIDELFDSIERDPYYIDSDYIWLPNLLLKEAKRGQVYRITNDLLNKAIQFKDKRITINEFKSYCKEYMESISPSEKETETFNKWEEYQIRKLIDLYHEDLSKHLKYREEDIKEE